MRRVTGDVAGALHPHRHEIHLRRRRPHPQRRPATGNAASPWLTTTAVYNAAGKPVTVTAADGTTQTTAYEPVGRVSTTTSSSERQVLYTYDLASRITRITDQVSGTLDPSITVNRGAVVREQRTYCPGSLLATLADGKSNTLTYKYDGFKRPKQVIYPDDTAAAPDFNLRGFDANGCSRVNIFSDIK